MLPGDHPVFTSHFVIGMLELQMYTSISCFLPWFWGTELRSLGLSSLVTVPLDHLPLDHLPRAKPLIFLLLSCMSSLYKMDTRPLSDI